MNGAFVGTNGPVLLVNNLSLYLKNLAMKGL